MAHDGQPTGVDAVVCLEVIQRAHAGPGVGSEHAPLVGLGVTLSVAEKQLVDATPE